MSKNWKWKWKKEKEKKGKNVKWMKTIKQLNLQYKDKKMIKYKTQKTNNKNK